jgi:hypothetical protein
MQDDKGKEDMDIIGKDIGFKDKVVMASKDRGYCKVGDFAIY